MENEKNLVTEQVAEKVEETTEQTQAEQTALPEKTYTQKELDAIVGKRLARNSAKIKKEYDRKYGGLEEVLKAGTGQDSVEEMTNALKDFYQKKGIQIPQQPTYTDRDIEVLANAEANDIIRLGYEEVVEEVDRLANIGADKMTTREKAVFKVLAEYRSNADLAKELAQQGVAEDVINSQEFRDFKDKFNPGTPVRDIYDIYNKTLPKKEIKTMGSMKNSMSEDSAVKEFYSCDEAKRFTRKELDANPELVKAIERSMLNW